MQGGGELGGGERQQVSEAECSVSLSHIQSS